jgi:hypothetical protein
MPTSEMQGKPLFSNSLVVPVERIELPTFGLQNRCSTAELNRQTNFNNQSMSGKFRLCLPQIGGGRGRRAVK